MSANLGTVLIQFTICGQSLLPPFHPHFPNPSIFFPIPIFTIIGGGMGRRKVNSILAVILDVDNILGVIRETENIKFLAIE